MDFDTIIAGGTVVHINSGIAGLVGALLIGKRLGYGKEVMAPHSLTLSMVGASLLWVGWFGFNAGSRYRVASRVWSRSRLRRATPARWARSCWA